MVMNDWKYEVFIISLEKGLRLSKELKEKVKNLGQGVGKRNVAKMKKEAMDCPVLKHRVSFLQCFFCSNFVRRVKGVVYCKGEQLRD